MSLNDNDELDFHKFFDLPHCNRSYNFLTCYYQRGPFGTRGARPKMSFRRYWILDILDCYELFFSLRINSQLNDRIILNDSWGPVNLHLSCKFPHCHMKKP